MYSSFRRRDFFPDNAPTYGHFPSDFSPTPLNFPIVQKAGGWLRANSAVLMRAETRAVPLRADDVSCCRSVLRPAAAAAADYDNVQDDVDDVDCWVGW